MTATGRPIDNLHVSHAAAARQLATTMRKAAAAPAASTTPTMPQGTIITVDSGTPPTCTVDIGNSGNPVPGVRYQSGYHPVNGDIVYMAVIGSTIWVVGALMDDKSTILQHYSFDVAGGRSQGPGGSAFTVATYNVTVVRPSIVRVRASVVMVGLATSSAGNITITDPFSNSRGANNGDAGGNGGFPQSVTTETEFYSDAGFGQTNITTGVGSTTTMNFYKFYSDMWIHRL